MIRIQNISHSKLPFGYACSRMFERAGFYGIRTVIFFYLMVNPFAFSDVDIADILGWLASLILLSNLLGGVLGDLLIGNKKALIIGAFIQAVGAFCMAHQSIEGLYLGLAGIVIGGGLYSPNLLSQFGKLYLDKTQLMDAGFSILFLMVNIGAFVGTTLFVKIGEKYGFHFGFIAAGVFLLIAGIIPLFIKDREFSESPLENAVVKVEHNQRLALFFSIIVLFWVFYEITALPMLDIQFKVSRHQYEWVHYWLLSSAAPLIIFNIIFPVVWSYFYTHQMVKLTIACVSATLAFAILLTIPEAPTSFHTYSYFVSTVLLGLAEFYISIIVHSAVTQYARTKYLAISMSFVPIAIGLIGFTPLLLDTGTRTSLSPLIFGTVGMLVISCALIIYHFTNKKSSSAKG